MQTHKLSRDTPIVGLDNVTIADFWAWALSDVFGNTNRGIFAEFLVASALGITQTPRAGWDFADLRYRDKLIEVKSSGYCQNWFQTRPSRIVFNIARTRSWHADTNVLDDEPRRAADAYVFCLFTETDQHRATVRVIDASAWRFYVLSAKEIENRFGNQKSVALSRIERVTDGTTHGELNDRVDTALGLAQAQRAR